SYTELEFHEATVAGKPRLVFLLDKPVDLPPELVDADTRAVGEFRKRLREAGLLVATFTSAEDLELKTFHALTQLNGDNTEMAPRRLPAAVDRSTATSTERATRNGREPHQLMWLEAVTIGGQVPVTSDRCPDAQDADVLPAVWNVPGRN